MRRWLILILVGCLWTPLFAQNKINLKAGTVEYHLKNGLTLIVQEDHRAPVVLVSIWYKVGSSYEHNGITGISHVLEHMMFKGTKRFGPGKYGALISAKGGSNNAMTTRDYTMYFSRLATDHLPLIFKLEADRMRHLVLLPQEFQKELKVVMAERRLRVDDNPQGLAWERFTAAAHVNNPYHHPVIGWMTDIKHLTVNDLKDWYQKWYAPNNAVVIVVGDVKPRNVEKLAKHYFGPLKKSPVTLLKPRREVPALGKKELTLHLPAKLPWLVMGYNTPVLSSLPASQRWQAYALEVLAYLLGAGNSSRFHRDLVRGSQVAVSASANYDAFELHNDLLMISGVPAPKHTVKALKQAFFEQINHLQQNPVSREELVRVKAQLIAQDVYGRDSLMRQAFELGVPEMVGLSWQDGKKFIAHIEAITPQQVQAVARKYLVTKRLTVTVLKPQAIKKGA